MRVAVRLALLSALLFVYGCGRTRTPAPEDALRPVELERVDDDLGLQSLAQAIRAQLVTLGAKGTSRPLVFGDRIYSGAEYARFLFQLLRIIERPGALPIDVLRNAEVFEAFGDPDWGDVLVTGYYQPRIGGSRRPNAIHRRALYRLPADRTAPTLTRAEIDSEGKLAGRNLELCYVDPIDAFFLQIQGSGVVELDDGTELSLAFAGKNGRAYTGIGKYVWDVIPKELLTAQRLIDHLRSLPEAEQQELLNKNESYVFFEPSSTHARTALGVPATAERTIAIDRAVYPLGALAVLRFPRPANSGDSSRMVERYVLSQDVGSAIKGAGRVDLFYGQGAQAGSVAGRTRAQGRLFFLAPKEQQD